MQAKASRLANTVLESHETIDAEYTGRYSRRDNGNGNGNGLTSYGALLAHEVGSRSKMGVEDRVEAPRLVLVSSYAILDVLRSVSGKVVCWLVGLVSFASHQRLAGRRPRFMLAHPLSQYLHLGRCFVS